MPKRHDSKFKDKRPDKRSPCMARKAAGNKPATQNGSATNSATSMRVWGVACGELDKLMYKLLYPRVSLHPEEARGALTRPCLLDKPREAPHWHALAHGDFVINKTS